MSDPWDQDAERIRAQRVAARRAAADAAERAAAEAAQQRRRADAQQQELKSAITEGTASLTAFMRKRGAAAQRLLATRGPNTFIYIGGHSGGGHYESYGLCGDGLIYVTGRKIGYTESVTGQRAATPEEVVHAYANGQGQRDPQKVRDIATWLTERVDAYKGR